MDYYHIKLDDKEIDELRVKLKLIFFSNVSQNVSQKKKDKLVTYKKYNIDENAFLTNEAFVKRMLIHLYEELHLGIKSIVKIIDVKELTYTTLRSVFKTLKIEIRKGEKTNDTLAMIRVINAKKAKRFSDWTSKSFKRNPDFGIQGWYKNKSNGKFVWLRSSWEYAFAKFLDESNKKWEFEKCSYLLKDGTYYRPDFFIYENQRIVEIVEIKSLHFGTSKLRLEKAERAKEEFQIPLRIITDEEMKNLFNLTKVLVEWKKTRILTKEIDHD